MGPFKEPFFRPPQNPWRTSSACSSAASMATCSGTRRSRPSLFGQRAASSCSRAAWPSRRTSYGGPATPVGDGCLLVYIYIYIYIYISIYISHSVCVCVRDTHVKSCKNIKYIYVYIYIYMYVYMYVYMYINTVGQVKSVKISFF